MIGEDNILNKALIKYDLNELATLRDLPSDEQISHIQSNLEIQPSEETDTVYQLRFRSRAARDAQTVLATLVSTYERHLDEKYRSPSPDVLELLLKMKERFAKELADGIEKVEQLEKQIAAGKTRKDDRAKLKEFQENVERIQSKLDVASGFESQQEQEQEQVRGFKFVTLSPVSKGELVYPLLPVFLLVGGCVGAFIGLITAVLAISVVRNR